MESIRRAKFIWVTQTLLGLSWVPDLTCPPEEPLVISWLGKVPVSSG